MRDSGGSEPCFRPEHRPVPERFAQLPGHEFVLPGLADLAAGRRTKEMLLVLMFKYRLRAAGVPVPDGGESGLVNAELYDLLEAETPRAGHGRYNALVRRTVSFCVAAQQMARYPSLLRAPIFNPSGLFES